MELEVREVSGEEKSKLGHRLKAYNNEMQRFEQDLVSKNRNRNITIFLIYLPIGAQRWGGEIIPRKKKMGRWN